MEVNFFMALIGRKKKAGSGRNKRGRSTPKGQFYGNGNADINLDKRIQNKTDLVAELPSPPIGVDTVGVSQEADRATPAQGINDSPNNQPCTPKRRTQHFI